MSIAGIVTQGFKFTPSLVVTAGFGSAPAVTVPDVVGTTEAAATTELEDAGFVVVVVSASSSTVAAGDVISQSPAAGSEVSEGSTVTITVSTGEASGNIMAINVALNGSKVRNFELFAGDLMTLQLTVYAEDGDIEPIAAEDVVLASIVTRPSGAVTIPVGSQFTVPDVCGYYDYRIVATVEGSARTLCYGKITIKGGSSGWPYRWDYGGPWGYSW